MSAICGVYNRNQQPVDSRIVERMVAATPQRSVDGNDSWSHGCISLAHQHFHITPEDKLQEQPLHHELAQLVLTADARIDNRAELGELLDISRDDLAKLSDAGLILAAYVRWGDRCVQYLLGDFAFLIWDAPQRVVFAARDALGTRGLNYFINDNVAVFGSEIAHVLEHPDVPREINDRKIVEYLANVRCRDEETYYQAVHALPPGHCMKVTGDKVTTWCFWSPDETKRIRYSSDEEYAEHYLELLTEAVRCRMRSTGPIAVSLSGGLDSSPLAAIMANLLPNVRPEQVSLKSYSYAFDRLVECDERRYIEPLVARYGIDVSYLPCDDLWTFRDFERWPALRDVVFYDAFAWLPEAVRRVAAAAGCSLLFAGYHGDTLFGLGRFWLADLLCRRSGLRSVVGPRLRPSYGRNLSELKTQVYILSPSRLRSRYLARRSKRLRRTYPMLHPALIQRTGLEDWVASEGVNEGMCCRGFSSRFGLLEVGRIAEGMSAGRSRYHEHGLELVQPYLDRRLVEFVLAVPSEQLSRSEVDRVVVRNALDGLVPDSIARRTDKANFWALFDEGLLHHERSAVRSLLDRPRVVQEGLVNEEWLVQQAADMGHWQDDGFLFWLCLSLELWLRKYW